jgi:hypothetical protein
MVLERLTPDERAVFLLREAFDYKFGEIAEIVGKSPAACRQIGARARRHVVTERPRFEPRGVRARSWRRASWPPPRATTSTGCSRCSPTTPC